MLYNINQCERGQDGNCKKTDVGISQCYSKDAGCVCAYESTYTFLGAMKPP